MPDEVSRSPVLAAEITPHSFKLLLCGLLLGLTLAALDQNIVATALPRITDELGGLAHLSWVVTSFLVASTVSAPLYGKLSDLYGRRPIYIASIVIFLAGSAICGFAGTLDTLVAFRAVQGLGAGGLIVMAQTVLADYVLPRERGRYQGLFSSVFTTCAVAGPLLGGVITQYWSWRWIFYVNLPVGAVALVLISAGLRARPLAAPPRLDFLGALLMMAGTSCLLLVLSWGGNVYAWSSAPILTLGAVALALLAVLVLVERRAANPVFPPDLFRNPAFVLGSAVLGISAMALFSAVVFLPLLFQLLMGASPAAAGLMIAPLMGGTIVASISTGRLISITGRYKIMPICGLIVATLAYLSLAWAVRESFSVLPIEFILVALGLGIGSTMPNLTTSIQNAVARDQLGAATATAAFFRQLGGATGVAMSGAVLIVFLHHYLPGGLLQPTTGVLQADSLPAGQRDLILATYRAGLSAAFLAGAAVAALGFVTVLFLPERPLLSKK